MNIKTPVKAYGEGWIEDLDGKTIISCAGIAAPEIAKRINLHGEMAEALRQVSESRIFCAESMDIDDGITRDIANILAKLESAR